MVTFEDLIYKIYQNRFFFQEQRILVFYEFLTQIPLISRRKDLITIFLDIVVEFFDCKYKSQSLLI